MKIEESNVIMKSDLKAKQEHKSTVVKFELTHGLSKLQENASKAHQATQALLNPDFSVYKGDKSRSLFSYESQLSPQDRCKKDILHDILDRFFQNDSMFLLPQKDIDEKTLEDSALIIETKEEYYQKQTIDFSSEVHIKTKDQTYFIDLEVGFTQELYELHQEKLELGKVSLLDPLVINYDDTINPFDNLSKLRFEFDLNSDGENEFIPLLKKGAGFLAHDLNNNGKIDNGSELFGPQTNQGFKELARHDKDKNNWIDENDAVFHELKIWQINENKENQLVSLLDLNIGAIYLGEVQSGFEYKNSINDISGVQKTNGVYVKNDGSGIRMINSLDLTAL